MRRGVQLKSLTPLIGGTTAPIFNTQFMKRETWEILLALESNCV